MPQFYRLSNMCECVMSPTSGIYWVDLGFINNYKQPLLWLVLLRYNADVASAFPWVITVSIWRSHRYTLAIILEAAKGKRLCHFWEWKRWSVLSLIWVYLHWWVEQNTKLFLFWMVEFGKSCRVGNGRYYPRRRRKCLSRQLPKLSPFIPWGYFNYSEILWRTKFLVC